jgi:hypothetical protein
MWRKLALLICAGLFACGGGGGSNSTDNSGGGDIASTGLKIFLTSRVHVGDFANDPTLVGDNAIEKADSFCNRDPNKPNNSYYKALIVDGVNRDAISKIDWVLAPNTTYYRSYNNIVIGTTNADAIFTAYWEDLENSIEDYCYSCDYENAWTGIDPRFFSSHNYNCNGWSTDSSSSAIVGYYYAKDGSAFGNFTVVYNCGNRESLYCVEQ